MWFLASFFERRRDVMITIRRCNPARQTAVLEICADGKKPRVVQKARFLKYRIWATGVKDAIFVGSHRGHEVTIKRTGERRWEELPETFVVPMAIVQAALAEHRQSA